MSLKCTKSQRPSGPPKPTKLPYPAIAVLVRVAWSTQMGRVGGAEMDTAMRISLTLAVRVGAAEGPHLTYGRTSGRTKIGMLEAVEKEGSEGRMM